MKQVIVIDDNGAIKGLEHRNGGIDLKQFGKALVERITLIEWDTEGCGWYIRWVSFDKPHKRWGKEELPDAELLEGVILPSPYPESSTVYFLTYEFAVAAEVQAIQRLQMEGLL